MSDSRPSNETPTLPGLEEIKQEVSQSATDSRASEQTFLRAFQKVSVDGERYYAHLKGLQDHYWHKSMWSWIIAAIMLFMVGFQSLLLGLVGAGIWSFEKYTWLLPALLVQNLAQVVGLAVFVVKALFKEMRLE